MAAEAPTGVRGLEPNQCAHLLRHKTVRRRRARSSHSLPFLPLEHGFWRRNRRVLDLAGENGLEGRGGQEDVVVLTATPRLDVLRYLVKLVEIRSAAGRLVRDVERV